MISSPYERDPRKWLSLPWFDSHTGDQRVVRPVSMPNPPWPQDVDNIDMEADETRHILDYLESVAVHDFTRAIEHHRTRRVTTTSSDDPDQRGVLSRLTVVDASIHYIGKESNTIDETAGIDTTNPKDRLTIYERLDAIPARRCLVCGRPMTYQRRSKRYCSKLCKHRAKRAREKELTGERYRRDQHRYPHQGPNRLRVHA